MYDVAGKKKLTEIRDEMEAMFRDLCPSSTLVNNLSKQFECSY